MGAGSTFSKPQALWSASYAGYVYHTYNFKGANDVQSFGVPMANAVLESEWLVAHIFFELRED
jgi:hypothetical protein